MSALKRAAWIVGITVASIIGGITSALAMLPVAALLFSITVLMFGA